MATLSKDDVRHIAKLCRLHIAENDLEKFATELTSILGFVDKLQEVNTEGVEPTPQATGLTNMFRDDVVKSNGLTTKELLACSPLPIVDNQIQTPSAHG